MNLTIRVWRQKNRLDVGKFAEYKLANISEDSSFLEMLDILSEQLVADGHEPVAFDHDCREGICGMCSMTINGIPHGPESGTTACQLHMRHFHDGQTITIEPWRAKPFPVIKDLVVDRTPLDKIIQAGGFITARAGSAVDANAMPIAKGIADYAMDAAACIGCGACVAACPNASAMLFTGAKVAHMNSLPQGKAEKDRRTLAMVTTMDGEGFGGCTNIGECEAACPKSIPLDMIAHLNRDYAVAQMKNFFKPVA
ncbi:succinate dehydrogenase/fumarate reductase iron-sulfur subunit [Coraliomargarita sp. SDUM461004]|uniref:Succinate dehydrogenase/fumarate reductase iron-sulfur subunit n=1 Tax=Thalassobacterium sedimentorum TaxID=3041258 RepID=A0ABU1AE26_9BACT|nr:succinate dehydrogenase/fumarate reductase iron-sulfur subunit [Coraliomargarita sp. SDUM461004]MDQ8193007.1 succinate dehydrogenase/fumarate reductase iron-sulfur subunit [Coraliomargarita sp. SDUM461004]